MQWNLCNGIPFFWKAWTDYHGQEFDKIVLGLASSGSVVGFLFILHPRNLVGSENLDLLEELFTWWFLCLFDCSLLLLLLYRIFKFMERFLCFLYVVKAIDMNPIVFIHFIYIILLQYVYTVFIYILFSYLPCRHTY